MFFFEFKRLSSEVKLYKDLVSKDFQFGSYFTNFTLFLTILHTVITSLLELID